MLIDFENTGYIKICPHPMVEEQCTYIPASTWGFIRGDIKEQSDLISLLTTIESGLTPEQIKLLVDTDSRFEDVEKSVIELDAKNTNEYVEINLMLDTKADAADVYSKMEIDNKGYLTEHQSLAGYATEQWVTEQNYLTEHQSLDNYYTKSEVDTAISNVDVDLSNYYTKSEIDAAFENIEVNVDLTGYATENWVNEGLLLKANITDVYTKTEIDNKGYLTQHQSLANYYTKSEVNAVVNTAVESKIDINQIWRGTEDEWDSLTVEQQNSYIIAMIEL